MTPASHIRDSRGDRIFYAVNTISLTLLLLIVAYPLYFVVIASISDISFVNAGEVVFWPKGISFVGYEKVLSHAGVRTGAFNTLFYTLAGTAINLCLTMAGAYALTVDFPGRGFINFLFAFTMFFSGGMIPSYFVIRSLGMLDTIWAMLLPGAVSMYNLIIARTFISSTIPAELFEAAQIDGCGKIRFFLSVVVPLSGTLIAILTLFCAVSHWNSYFNAILYINERKLYPLQLILREILVQNQVAANEIKNVTDIEGQAALQKIADSMKYSLIIISTLPILVVYPFLQKYFVKGVMIGSVKG